MNILFVNYGDFSTNSLNHIAGFANSLCAGGHACAVAVPKGRDTLRVVAEPRFIPATFDEVLARPRLFPDGRAADLIHAWTPREAVRRFILEYQRRAPTRVLIHLEDNEDFLIETFSGKSSAELRQLDELAEGGLDKIGINKLLDDGLVNPLRYRSLLSLADGVTLITESLRRWVPARVPAQVIPPGVDFSMYHPQEAEPALRGELGLRDGEKVIVFTGSNTFANEPDMRELYLAVKLLNQNGTPTRLVRTGFSSHQFKASLGFDWEKCVVDLGFVKKSRLPKLLALADVLVQPGRAGDFNDYRLPSKLPEFLAMGKPVILPRTNLGRILQDGRDALVLENGSPQEIAAACARVFADPDLAARLSRNAPLFARAHFDLAANTAKLAAFYAETIGRPVNPRWGKAHRPGTTEATLAAGLLADILAPSGGESAAIAADLALLVGPLENRAATTRDQLRLVESELAVLRPKFGKSEEGFRLSRQHATNLEKLRRSLQRRVYELDAQCEHLTRTIEARDDRIGRLEGKVRMMQESFSWRATAWLRFLRRKLIDDRPSVVPQSGTMAGAIGAAPIAKSTEEVEDISGPLFVSSVDDPQSWSLRPRTVRMRGWCFAESGEKLTGVRAVLSGRIVNGTYGLKRLDILAFAPDKPRAEYCGWRLDLPVTPADTQLDLEVADETGTWHRFFRTTLRVGEDLGPPDLTSYEDWIEVYDQPTPEQLRRLAAESDRLARQPLISVVMPVHDTPVTWLEKAVESVRAQTYRHWELCIADDASTDPEVRRTLEKFKGMDARIKVVFRSQNGHISAASNSALELATGEYIALLDHDDTLAPNALHEVAVLLNTHPDTDWIYSDEDKIDDEDRRREPYFKPDFLPDLFLAQNYTTHLSVYRASLVRAAGGFRTGYEGSQDWDLALRILEQSDPARIRHIPKILYHWRAIPGSTALMLSEKNYPFEAARRALAGHFERRGQPVELIPVPGDHWRVKYPLPSPPPLVSLIIPTRNSLALLRRCVDSILEKTSYPNFEIIVVDNGSDDPATLEYLRSLEARAGRPTRVIRHDQPFNYSQINNRGVREARGEVIGLINNDLEVINPGWLEEMTTQALRPGIGCVGAILYYPNETIQHAGSIIGIGGVAGHAFLDFPRGGEGKFNRARLVQNYSAVTGACLLVRKSIYEEIGGLDEVDLAVAFNDVDFCLKVRAAGYRNLWTPFAELYHHESASRGADDTHEKKERFRREVEIMLMRWGPVLQSDPAYNPNLTLDSHDFSLASPPRA